jgi:hypothetical protein
MRNNFNTIKAFAVIASDTKPAKPEILFIKLENNRIGEMTNFGS